MRIAKNDMMHVKCYIRDFFNHYPKEDECFLHVSHWEILKEMIEKNNDYACVDKYINWEHKGRFKKVYALKTQAIRS